MTITRKLLIEKLLTGHYLMQWLRPSGLLCYRLYDKTGSPVERVLHKTVRTLDPTKTIWKADKVGRIRLKISAVKELSNRHTITKLYKESKKK